MPPLAQPRAAAHSIPVGISKPHTENQTPIPQRPATLDGLYIHVPFCFHKCHYCDFYSLVDSGDRQAVFVRRLIEELEWSSQRHDLRPRTIFVGGGTPTLLRPELWQDLLEALRRLGTTSNVQEFTVEANPETVTPGLMTTLARGGVNRVSIGAQSFHSALLKTLERWHEPTSVGRAAGYVRDAGIENVNLDLIFAVPGQTLDMLNADLDSALGLGPTHVSCYGLTYEPNTAMTTRLRLGQFAPAPEELEKQMYETVMDRLAGAGFEHYEISNWAQPGRRCAHNLMYWTNDNWLGVGPSAASHVAGHRWKNAAHLGRYLSQTPPPTSDHEQLSPGRSVGEQLMLRLRLREGVTRSWLEKHLAPDDPRRRTITELIQVGMLEWTDTHLRLTRRGLFVADPVIAKLL